VIGETRASAGPDVRRVLRRLESQPAGQRQAMAALLEQRGADFNVFPLSSAQQRLWLSSMLNEELPLYNVSYGFRLTGDLDTGALSRALQALVRRHEMLRTIFFEVDGRPYQAVLPELRLPLSVGRLPGRGGEREALVARALDAEARRPLDLRRGPLVRAVVLTSPEDGDHLLVLTLHHIICDGWSMVVLFRELGELYAAILEGRPPALRPLPTRYVDYARWQARRVRGPAVQEQLRYWVDRMRDAPPLVELPGDRPRPAVQTFQGGLEATVWPLGLAESLDAFCRRENVTTFIALLAAFDALVHRWSGRDDVVVGVPFANRDRAELEDVIGFFVNTLVLRVRLSGRMTFRELLHAVRDVTFAAQGNQDLPFEMLVDALKPDRSANHHPLFQLSFAVQDAGSERLVLRGLDSRLVLGHSGTSKFDLVTSFTPIAGGLRGTLEYDTGLFDRSRARRVFADLRAIVVAAMADPDVPLSALPAGS
jgi:Condensation domain